jgi:hypothetical protein
MEIETTLRSTLALICDNGSEDLEKTVEEVTED